MGRDAPDSGAGPSPDPIRERWEEVDRLFDEALDRPPGEREAFVARRCEGDPELRVAVTRLLDALDPSDGMFETPGADLLGAALADDPETDARRASALPPGETVGRYRILREIGRGGMATVYEAERADGTFERRVALKVIRRGLDTEEVIRRFLAERQILSELSHPNIARLIDGGTTDDGRPYLVLERVEGTPVTEWADTQRLTVEQRLDLFLQLADAVHFAHRRLVVHRDLKPSNVLVDGEGRLHLLDFGIAKILEPRPGAADLTRVDGPRPLTPAFASPEQLRGDSVTTASDVYQLGVILHLLLTGRKPPPALVEDRTDSIPPTAPSEAARRPPVTDPGEAGGRGDGETASDTPEGVARNRRTSVSGLRRMLAGDLDTIVLKALREEPEERYPSAEALATDIRRHLAGRPVAARPPSAAYRLRKFHGRKPWIAPLAAALVVAVVSYVVAVVHHSAELEVERNEARAEAERADQLRGFVVDLFRAGDPYGSSASGRSREMTVVEALEVGVDRVRQELAGRPDLQAAMLGTIADVYLNLDDTEAARSVLQEAFELHRSSRARVTRESALLLAGLSQVAARTMDLDSAVAVARRWVDAEMELAGPESPGVADALLSLSNHEFNLNRFEDALAHREEAAAILRRTGPGHEDALASTLAMLSDSYRDAGRLGEAEAAAREALALHQGLWGPGHPKSAQQRIHLAQVLQASGRLEEARSEYREALPVLERILGPDHFITENSWNNLAIVLMRLGRFGEAEDVHRRVLAQRTGPGDVQPMDVASSLQNLAAVLLRQGRYAEADSLAMEAHRVFRAEAPPGSHLPALPLLIRTEIQLAAGQPASAEPVARRAAEILHSTLPEGHYATAVAECRLGLALARQGRGAEGAPLVRSALEAARAWEGTPRRNLEECRAAMAEVGAVEG